MQQFYLGIVCRMYAKFLYCPLSVLTYNCIVLTQFKTTVQALLENSDANDIILIRASRYVIINCCAQILNSA